MPPPEEDYRSLSTDFAAAAHDAIAPVDEKKPALDDGKAAAEKQQQSKPGRFDKTFVRPPVLFWHTRGPCC